VQVDTPAQLVGQIIASPSQKFRNTGDWSKKGAFTGKVSKYHI
jgi:hypothetical protein